MFLGACAVMPAYLAHAADSAVPHQDVFFNMWRVSWFAHALRVHGSLWDANIFSPERWTLAMSDAVPVESVVGAALLWLRLPPVLVHNCLIVGAMVGSGVAMACLAWYLTGSRGAGAVAGLIFAFAPYRIEHLMHLELQWAMWIPLTLLAVHVAVDEGRRSLGVAIGLGVSLQLLSCVYYGVFLATMLAVGAPLFVFVESRRDRRRSAAIALALGACIAGAAAAAYALPYRHAEQIVGARPSSEVASYSARLDDYLAVPESSWLYGDSLARRGAGERRLFVGAAAMLLAIIGLVSGRLDKRQLVYLGLAVFAVAMSLGSHGYLYSAARAWLLPYRGLRVPARFAIMTLLCVSCLAAYGYARIAAAWPRARHVLACGVISALMLEYHVALPLVPYANEPSPVYKVLSRLPRGKVAEFPMPLPHTLPGNEAEYQYMSTFHWNPLVNGYSGNYPPSYLKRLVELRGFPDDRALAQLRRDDVSYAIVHASAYDSPALARIVTALERESWPRVGGFNDGGGETVLYMLPRAGR